MVCLNRSTIFLTAMRYTKLLPVAGVFALSLSTMSIILSVRGFRVDLLLEEWSFLPQFDNSTQNMDSSSLEHSHFYNAAKDSNRSTHFLDVSYSNELISNNGKEVMSACLLIMDDNHWLIEWLAFHYTVIDLRNIVFVRDPFSRTSPYPIFDRWRGRIQMQEWTDADILPSWVKRKFHNGDLTRVLLHRYRQQFFYAKCLKHIKESNRTWVMMIDTDEFVRSNPYHPAAQDQDMASGSVLQWMNERITSYKENTPRCLYVPRLQMSVREEDDASEQNDGESLFGFNASHMLTTRWFYHNGQEISIKGHNLDGKNLINVAWLESGEIPRKAETVHYVIPDICPSSDGDRLNHTDSWLLIHHYVGTFEQFSFREDPREALAHRPSRVDREVWKNMGEKPVPSYIRDDFMKSWLPNFVQAVGLPAAKELLKDVGVVLTI